MKGSLSFDMVSAAMGLVKSPALGFLLLYSLLCIADSYPNINELNTGCEECTLRRNKAFSIDRPVYQCMGCCFSKSYPTTLKGKNSMPKLKNITSEATCCVADESHETKVLGIPIQNHTACQCSTCYNVKV